jgi:hypothetical protein
MKRKFRENRLALVILIGVLALGAAYKAKYGYNVHAVVTIDDLERMIAAGEITGCKRRVTAGYNLAIASTTTEDIQSQGGTLTHLTTATALEFVSDDSNDNASGSGCRAFTFGGLNGSWEYTTETVAAHASDGTTAVNLTNTYIRLYEANCSSRGTYGGTGPAAGKITVRVDGGGATVLEIPEHAEFGTNGWSSSSHYTVPKDKRTWVYALIVDVEASKGMAFAIKVRTNDTNMTSAPFAGVYNNQVIWEDIEEFVEVDLTKIPFYIPQYTDIWMQARAVNTTGSASVNMIMYECDV